MLDCVLAKHKSYVRITVKTTISVLLVIMAFALPQLTHAIGGAEAGSVYMPMYMPALLAGLLLGWQWGLAVGLLSPTVSYGFTLLASGTAMPSLQRLPYMILETGAYGLITGLFSGRAAKNALLAFPAVLAAQATGRAIYIVYNLIAGRDFASLWASVQTGLTGLWLQAIIVPLAAMLLFAAMKDERQTE